jgi:hypothetical protein
VSIWSKLSGQNQLEVDADTSKICWAGDLHLLQPTQSWVLGAEGIGFALHYFQFIISNTSVGGEATHCVHHPIYMHHNFLQNVTLDLEAFLFNINLLSTKNEISTI